MALALEDRAKKDDIMLGDTPKARRRRSRMAQVQTAGRLWKHSTLADIDGLITPEQIAEYFTFTLVRNPWDRVVSYYHWLQEQSFDHPAVRLAQGSTFTQFLNHAHTQMSLSAAPASFYMTDIRGQQHCNAYIRLEHLYEDARPLWDHLGFELDLPHVNRSNRIDYHRYYTEEDAQIVARTCAADVAQFGYCYE